MPILTLAVSLMAIVTRMTRSAVLETTRSCEDCPSQGIEGIYSEHAARIAQQFVSYCHDCGNTIWVPFGLGRGASGSLPRRPARKRTIIDVHGPLARHFSGNRHCDYGVGI